MATAGRPISLSFNVYTKVFQYQFYLDPNATLPTGLFMDIKEVPLQ